MDLPHHHADHPARLTAEMPGEESCAATAELLRLLCDGKRLQIFWLLCHCEECVVNIAALTHLSAPAASHHLKQLKDAGLIVSCRHGREVHYRAADTERTQVLHDMLEAVMEMACPAQALPPHTHDTQDNVMTQVHDLLTADLSVRYTIDELCARFHMNPTTLKAQFKRFYGQPIAAYMKHYRLKHAANLLLQTDESILSIASRVGYENPSKFTRAFREQFGVLPKDYRK